MEWSLGTEVPPGPSEGATRVLWDRPWGVRAALRSRVPSSRFVLVLKTNVVFSEIFRASESWN